MTAPTDINIMRDILAKTLALVITSKNSGWPDEQPDECAETLRRMIDFVTDPQPGKCPEFAAIQFLPTGPIQEIAMANGWHDAYPMLADAYDKSETRSCFFSGSSGQH